MGMDSSTERLVFVKFLPVVMGPGLRRGDGESLFRNPLGQ
jgi:hypothetical protein